jgi:hypothetical protein
MQCDQKMDQPLVASSRELYAANRAPPQNFHVPMTLVSDLKQRVGLNTTLLKEILMQFDQNMDRPIVASSRNLETISRSQRQDWSLTTNSDGQ